MKTKIFIYLCLSLYNLIMSIFSFCIFIYSLFNTNNTKYDQRLLKQYKKSKSKEQIIWIHGSSIGEIKSIHKLVENIQNMYPNYQILITSNTYTSQQILCQNFSNIMYQFLPYDCKFLVNKFLQIYNPSLAIFVEQDLFPMFLYSLKKLNIPILLINARMSDKSFLRWKKLKFIIKYLLSNFNEIFPSSVGNLYKFSQLSDVNCNFLGNLKFTSYELIDNTNIEYNKLQNLFKDKIIFLGISTHIDEEKILVQSHLNLHKKFPNLITLIMPRYIDRISLLKRQFHNIFNIDIPIYSNNNFANKDLIFLDTLGKTSLFCFLSHITFIGKSLSTKKRGGQNLFEPILYNSVPIFGTSIENFIEIGQDIIKHNAGIQVKDEIDLQNNLEKLLNNPTLLNDLQNNGKKLLGNPNEIIKKHIEILKCYLNA